MSLTAFITVRTSSSRLPAKCFSKLGETSALDFVIKRAKLGGIEPIICTSLDSSDDSIVDFANENNLPIFRGDLENKIKRWHDCAIFFNLESFHVIDADDPFFDPIECIQAHETFKEKNLDAYLTSFQSDSGEASVGTSFSTEFIKTLNVRTGELQSSNLDVIPWDLLIKPADKVDRKKNRDTNWNQVARFRLTLDYKEDLKLLQKLANLFGPSASRVDIENYLMGNPDLISINLFRSQDFIANKNNHLESEFRKGN